MAQSVDLEPFEWQQVISALAMTNPLLVKISAQLSQQQAQQGPGGPGSGQGILRPGSVPGNSKEPHHGL